MASLKDLMRARQKASTSAPSEPPKPAEDEKWLSDSDSDLESSSDDSQDESGGHSRKSKRSKAKRQGKHSGSDDDDDGAVEVQEDDVEAILAAAYQQAGTDKPTKRRRSRAASPKKVSEQHRIAQQLDALEHMFDDDNDSGDDEDAIDVSGDVADLSKTVTSKVPAASSGLSAAEDTASGPLVQVKVNFASGASFSTEHGLDAPVKSLLDKIAIHAGTDASKVRVRVDGDPLGSEGTLRSAVPFDEDELIEDGLLCDAYM